MERTAWTDERLNEKMEAADTLLDRIHDDLGGIREEMRAMRSDFGEEMRAMRSDFVSLQNRLVQIGFGLVFALIGAVAALIAAVAS